MRKMSVIFRLDETSEFHAPAPNNPNEYPPPHGLSDGCIAVEIIEATEDLHQSPSDYEGVANQVHQCEYKNGKLHRKGKALKAQCVEKLRMNDGVLEDNTVNGWKARAIFEPFVDDSGEEIEGPDGMPEGQWYAMGPRTKDGTPNLIPIGEPGPQDRRVWKGTQGNEMTPDWFDE